VSEKLTHRKNLKPSAYRQSEGPADPLPWVSQDAQRQSRRPDGMPFAVWSCELSCVAQAKPRLWGAAAAKASPNRATSHVR